MPNPRCFFAGRTCPWLRGCPMHRCRGFPGGTSGKEPAYQCRRHKRCKFVSWFGKISWRNAGQPTPVFLPGVFHRLSSMEGYSLQGYKESDSTEGTQHICTDVYEGIIEEAIDHQHITSVRADLEQHKLSEEYMRLLTQIVTRTEFKFFHNFSELLLHVGKCESSSIQKFSLIISFLANLSSGFIFSLFSLVCVCVFK